MKNILLAIVGSFSLLACSALMASRLPSEGKNDVHEQTTGPALQPMKENHKDIHLHYHHKHHNGETHGHSHDHETNEARSNSY
jgi:ABC-type nickel/cobalt efflux system permease component RcnA